MKPLPHRYALRLAGGPDDRATLTADGMPSLRSAPPLEFGGPGDAWSPEHLLLAAVASCYFFTLRAVTAASKLQLDGLALGVEGTVDRTDGRLRFTDVTVRPELRLAPGVDEDRVRRALDKAGRACLVSASMATVVRVEPELIAVGA
jgi:peroxiredoxin-like protein